MIDRMIYQRLKTATKNVLVLGPRQVGKSTIIRSLKPDRFINLMDESLYISYAKNPGSLARELSAVTKPSLIAIDEIQRIPSLLNTIQALLDEGIRHRFIVSGSSARKLKRGHANLLPGRMVIEYLDPLSFWELGSRFNLEKVLQIGSLPGIYLDKDDAAHDILENYGQIYLREEIQAEALARNIGHFGRFVDLAAQISGQWVNYTKLSSDSEIPKETLRRFFSLLEDTLVAFRVPAFRPKTDQRRVSQRERFIFFDLGVRNALLGLHRGPLSPMEKGLLFEQWIFLQLITFIHSQKKHWNVSSFRTDTGSEVDWILETPKKLIAIECKYSHRVGHHDLGGMKVFESFTKRPVEKYLVFTGAHRQKFSSSELAIPFGDFLSNVLPSLT